MTKVGIIILCRYSSSRLPGKILKRINGKPILQYILERAYNVRNANEVIVATSDDPSDDIIEQYCRKNEINCFRGSLQNVLERFTQAANDYKLDYAIRINGDNLFVDSGLMDEMIEIARANEYELITNVPGRTFPYGMSIEVISVKSLNNLLPKIIDPKHQEHVTLFFYENPATFRTFVLKNSIARDAQGFKLAIDEEEDLQFAENIINSMNKPHFNYSLKELWEIIKTIK